MFHCSQEKNSASQAEGGYTLADMKELSGIKDSPILLENPITLNIRIEQTVKEQSICLLQAPILNLLFRDRRWKLTARE
jgi:hypothetical protein